MNQLKIGDLLLKYPTVLAPMASLTDIVFRRAVDEIGGIGLMVTELISAEGLRRKQRRTLEMIRNFDFRTPQFIQLFGTDADAFAESIKFIENETSYSGIDINMGCPARKVTRKGAGSALLLDPAGVGELCRSLKRSTTIPLTVKIRIGYEIVNLHDILSVLEDADIDAVTIHFRLRSENYSGPAHWEYAEGLREKFDLTLIGNGDIQNRSDAINKLTLVDGVMIGRAAIKDPFIFSEIAGYEPGMKDKQQVAERIMELIEEYYPTVLRLQRIKAFTKYLTAGRPHSRKIKHEIYRSGSFEEVKSLFKIIFN
ncbi:MAG: tRNA-dihydrouridine synthase family protein [Acidobacteriota bacterium]